MFEGVGEQVTVIRRVQSGVNAKNQPIYTNITTVWDGVVVGAQTDIEDNTVDRDLVLKRITLYFTENAENLHVKSQDKVIVRGEEYQFIGTGILRVSPFDGEVFGFTIKAERTEG